MKPLLFISLFSTLLLIPGASAADPQPSVPAALLPAAKQAKAHFDSGNYREAEKIYESILAAEPNNLYALSNLGVTRFRSGKLKLAEEAFRQAITVSPNDAFSHCTLGIVYYSQARYDDAIKSLRRAIELDPKNAAAHNYLGITYSQKGMDEEAAKELQKARELDPSYNEYKPDKLPKEIPPTPQRMSPNHALQRTAPRVTLAAADRPAACAHPAPAALPQPARRAPQSLSLGSFGDFARAIFQ